MNDSVEISYKKVFNTAISTATHDLLMIYASLSSNIIGYLGGLSKRPHIIDLHQKRPKVALFKNDCDASILSAPNRHNRNSTSVNKLATKR